MALEYVVTKRVFGFDKDKNEKYVAKSVRSGKVNFAKMCRKVSELCGVHRKVVDLVVSGLVDKMAEDIDDGKSVQMGEFGIFTPTIRAKSTDDEKEDYTDGSSNGGNNGGNPDSGDDGNGEAPDPAA